MQYRIAELHEFPHDIIYTFSPESTIERIVGGSTLVKDGLYIESMQYVDLLEAYLYAQNEILPEIRHLGLEDILPEQWTGYIINIHRRIAQQLLRHADKTSGAYDTTPLWRWHHGTPVYFMIHSFLSATQSPSEKKLKKFCSDLADTYEHDYNDVLAFMTLVIRLKNKSTDFGSFMADLLYKYHTGELSVAEKAIIDKIAKPGSLPEQIHTLMEGYGHTLQGAIQTLDKKNPLAISRFLASQFYGLTHIHPFSNCNGRTATCLINVLLRALEQPAIILRDPQDRAEKGAYAEAMSIIDSDLEPFTQHIFQRLQARQPRKNCDTLAKQLTDERIQTALAYQKIWESNAGFDVDTFQNEISQHFEHHIASKKMLESIDLIRQHGTDMSVLATIKTIHLFQYIRKILEEKVAPRPTSKRQDLDASISQISAISLTTESLNLNSTQQLSLCQALQQLTDVTSGWVLYKKGTIALYQSQDRAEIQKIAQKLRETAACHVEITALAKDKSMHVIKVTQINLERLERCTQMQSSELFHSSKF